VYKHIVMGAMALVFLMSGIALADKRVIEYDTNDISQKQQEYLESFDIKKKHRELVPSVDAMAKWAEVGKGIAVSLSAACKELSIGVNEFVKTPVGKLTTALIVWKVIGKDIWHMLLGFILFFVTMPIVISSFVYFHMRKKVKHEDGTITYIERYEWEGPAGKIGSAWAHGLTMVLIVLFSFIIAY